MGRSLRLVPFLVGALACVGIAGAATTLLTGPAARAAQVVPGVPAGNDLLETVTVPATTPFNSQLKQLKTRFRNGATYYFVATGTATLPVGRSIDAMYCFNADPPTGGCPPNAPIGPLVGLNMIWYSGNTFANYSFTRAYGDTGQGLLRYQPTHRYVFRMTAPLAARVALGGPRNGDPAGFSGGFTVKVYGPPPKTDNVRFDINIHLVDEPILIHVRKNIAATPLDGTIYVSTHHAKVVADGKHRDRGFPAWISDSDTPPPRTDDIPHGHVALLQAVEATIDATPTTRELTLEVVVTSATGYSGQKTCAVGDTAKIVLVDGEPKSGGSTDSYEITWTSGICRTHNHFFNQADADYRKGERVRVDIFCYSPTRGYRKEVC